MARVFDLKAERIKRLLDKEQTKRKRNQSAIDDCFAVVMEQNRKAEEAQKEIRRKVNARVKRANKIREDK